MSELLSQKEFIEYLSGLAEQEETFLFVRQKLINGKFYTDGVQKATWIPFLPEASGSIKKNWAVYGNTGSFVLDRMADRVSASSANCDYVLCMVLDDIGTKSKEPPLPPTWVMETSEGNYQWGYVFSEQPRRGAFAAAIRAIAEAGFTDPGACNPVRNFRLPGSVNLKVGKGNFVSRLVEFHPDREFTLDAICEALEVTPGHSDSEDGYQGIHISRTNDEVLNWLSDNGYVLSGTNHDGWCQVVCPNCHNHTDKADVAGKYKPNDRGFTCYHTSCQDFSSQDFLDWVASNGGPSVNHGVSDGDVQNVYASALSKLPESKEERDKAQAELAEFERKQTARLARGDFFKRFAYIMSDDAYFDFETREDYSRSVFNAVFRHIECNSMHSGRKIEASVWFDENRDRHNGALIKELTYAPGEGALVMRDGSIYGNRWRDARPQVDKTSVGDIGPWMEHAHTLFENEDELNHVLDVMAFKLQNPKQKINHAVLLAGRQGIGKDTMFAPLIWGVCGSGYRNHGELTGKMIHSGWGDHLESEILVLNELKESSAAERRALANELKPVIAAPPEFLTVNRKNKSIYKVVNRTFVIAFSNERNPISVAGDDRRWFVVWSEAKPKPESYYKKLWNWYNSGGLEACVAWLYRRDVSAFNPSAPPKYTEYKMEMIDGGRTSAGAYLTHMITEEQDEFRHGIVGSPFHLIADRLNAYAPEGIKIHHSAIVDALQEAGWENIGRLASREHPSKKQVWVSPRMYQQFVDNKFTKSEARNMVEQTPNIKILKHA